MQSVLGEDSITEQRKNDRKWQMLCLAIFLCAIVTRFLFLDDKPYHHDESLHAYYSNRVAQGHPHEYSALLHGPVLYYLTGAFMAVFGAGEFLARVPAALCSVALVMLPLFWRRLLGKPAALAVSLFFLLSPTLMYFGRFLREDAFNSFWIIACLSSFCAFLVNQKPRYAILASAFLAMQFCNKENSYLHLFVWLSGYLVSLLLMRSAAREPRPALDIQPTHQLSKSDKLVLMINCSAIFSFIFILFYSSFFRHSKGVLHGVIDGLYRESLLYWWEQNQKRRIDGPFDYHIPLFLNYEFALIPAIVLAWIRSVRLAVQTELSGFAAFVLGLFRKTRFIFVALMIAVVLLLLPRIGLSSAGCSISEHCASTLFSQSISNALGRLAQLLHIAHTRHLIQIILMVVFGGIAFVANAQLRRSVDSFLWWWLTGAVGIYSYVGEKVPWLLVYIVLPAAIVAGLEVGRQCAIWAELRRAKAHSMQVNEKRQAAESDGFLSQSAIRVFLIATAGLMLFTLYKALRVSFISPASPHERLVFTQTTHSIKNIRTRWMSMMEKARLSPKIAISGDATWPMSWYSYDIRRLSFSKPQNAVDAESFDAVFLDRAELDFAYNAMNSFDIYEVPLRHWWVPKPNPTSAEILEYFLTGRPYPRELEGNPIEQGIGDATVLYLENRGTGRFFSKAESCDCGRLLREAQLQMSAQPKDLENYNQHQGIEE